VGVKWLQVAGKSATCNLQLVTGNEAMLKQILTEFERSPTTLCLDELSRKLGVTPSALEGMLDTLARKGRLLEINSGPNACLACPARGGCVILRSTTKSYISVQK
jgi:hypothetical protein